MLRDWQTFRFRYCFSWGTDKQLDLDIASVEVLTNIWILSWMDISFISQNEEKESKVKKIGIKNKLIIMR